MTLDKAIEILTDLLGEGPQFPPDDRRDAVKLGIEALNCIRILRIIPDKRLNLRLKSETPDAGSP